MFTRVRPVLYGVIALFFILISASCTTSTPTPASPSPSSSPSPTTTPSPSPSPGPSPTPDYYSVASNPQFGITWSTNFRVATPIPPTQRAAGIGAAWDRWTFEWPRLEYRVEQEFYFSETCNDENCAADESWDYDQAVADDDAAGLNILGVLNGIPESKYYQKLEDNLDGIEGRERGTIQGLDEPPLIDGNPNPANPWAYFVYNITFQYAAAVSAWEIGNENDDLYVRNFPLTPEEYVKALRVACTVINQTDPGATILLGSPTYSHGWQELGLGQTPDPGPWYSEVLQLVTGDPMARTCIGAISLHTYGDAEASHKMIDAMSERLPEKDVWLTETGLQHPELIKGVVPGTVTDSIENCPIAIDEHGESYHPFPCGTTAEQASYVIRHFAWTLKGLKGGGVIFHHRLMDEVGIDGPWGLIQRDTQTRWPSYWAALLVAQKLNGAEFVDDTYSNGDEYVQLTFKSQQGEYIHVVWGTPHGEACVVSQGATEATLFTQESLWPRDQTPNGWVRTFDYEPEGRSITAITQEDQQCFPLGESLGDGRTYVLIELNKESLAPNGEACLVCENGQVVGTDILVYDDYYGLDTGSVHFSPERSWDLSWTEPGVQYAYTTDEFPPAGGSGTFTLTNKGGLYTTQTISNPVDYCTNNPGTPGGDHPDDNYSSADGSPLIPPGDFYILPSGARPPGSVAVLRNGYSHELWQLLLKLGEPASYLETDFDPAATARKYAVLLIPSGGLYGLENSPSFRARLEEYTRLGGTVVSFSQQRGSEYGVLPGGQVAGYGWTEDNSCFEASLHLSQWHPMLSGIDAAALDTHVDGYFTTLPENAQVLLSRTANGRPAVALYTFGEGFVVATTLFDDWGIGHGQSAADAQLFLRDLLAWAVPDQPDLAVFAPGDIDIDIPITNTFNYTTSTISWRLVDPARQVELTGTYTVELPAGAAATLPFTPSLTSPLGIYRVEARLVTADGYTPARWQAVATFALSDPDPTVAPGRDLYLNITAPTDHFIPNTVAPFTFHVLNQSDVKRTVTIRYGLPHHTWESGDRDTYGEFHDHSHTLVVPAHGEATFIWRIPVFTVDRLWAKLLENDWEVDRAHFALWQGSAQAQVAISADPALWLREHPVGASFTVANPGQASWDGTLEVEVVDSTGWVWHTNSFSMSLDGEGQLMVTDNFTVPRSVADGTTMISTIVRDDHQQIVGGSHAAFTVPASPLVFDVVLPSRVALAESQYLTITVRNERAGFDVSSGVLTATLTDPAATVTELGVLPIALAYGEEITLSVPFTVSEAILGAYRFNLEAVDEYGARSWQEQLESRVTLAGDFDAPFYRAAGTLELSHLVANEGNFAEELLISVQVPAVAYSATRSTSLPVGNDVILTDRLTLPLTLTAGSHAVVVQLRQLGGETLDAEYAFDVPPSKLRASLPAQSFSMGDSVLLELVNDGGEAAVGTYRVALRDFSGRVIHQVEGEIPSLDPLAATQVVLPVPAGVQSGAYVLTGRVTDQQANQVSPFAFTLQLDGVDSSLTAATDQSIYSSGTPVNVTAELDNLSGETFTGTLDLQIVHGGGGRRWQTFNYADLIGLVDGVITDIAIDAAGRIWFGTQAGLIVLDHGGDPLDKTLHRWLSFTDDKPWSDSAIRDIEFDQANYAWILTADGLHVFNDDGTFFDQTDDAWRTFTQTNGLVNTPGVLMIDDAGRKWILGYGELNVFDDNGTPFADDGDRWETFTTADGLAGPPCYSEDYCFLNENRKLLTVDSSGYMWIGTINGLSVLDYGQDPFADDDGDRWTTFTSTQNLPTNHNLYGIHSVMIDEDGYKWINTEYVLDDGGDPFNRNDHSWAVIERPESSYLEGLLAVDSGSFKWFAIDSPLGSTIGVLDDHGDPFAAPNDWTIFDEFDPFQARTFAIGPAGYVWAGAHHAVTVLSHNQTPLQKADDSWVIYGTHYYPFSPTNNWYGDASLDVSGNKVFAHGDSVLLLDDSETPFDQADDIWEHYYPPIDTYPYEFEALSVQVDQAGYHWISSGLGGVWVWDNGGTAFIRSDDVWRQFTHSDLLNCRAANITVDPVDIGRKWILCDYGQRVLVLDDGGVPFDLDNTIQVGEFSGSNGVEIHVSDDDVDDIVAFDNDGAVWFPRVTFEDGEGEIRSGVGALDYGLDPLDGLGDTWVVYTQTSSGLSLNDVDAVAIDSNNRKWFAFSGTLLMLDTGPSLTDKSDDSWQSFTAADGAIIPSYLGTLEIDADGRKWLIFDSGSSSGVSIFDDHGTPFDRSDDTWQYFGQSDGLASDQVTDVVVDSNGFAWVTTYDGVSLYGVAEESHTLWSQEQTVEFSPYGELSLSEMPGALGATGAFELLATLTSPTGQQLDEDRYRFYVYPDGLALTLEPSVELCRPGEAIELAGHLQNTGALTLTDKTLTIAQDGAIIHMVGPLTLLPGADQAFNVSTLAPAGTSSTVFTATVGDIRIFREINVGEPAVSASVQAPSLVGSEPFSVTVLLTNTGVVAAQVGVENTFGTASATLAPHETQLWHTAGHIAQDTIMTTTFTGDLSQVITQAITFGEQLAAVFTVPTAVDGEVGIAYTLSNTGQLPLLCPVTLTVTDLMTEVWRADTEFYLPLADTRSGEFDLALPAGDYSLSYHTPYQAGSVPFSVIPAGSFAMASQVQVGLENEIGISTILTNTTVDAFHGELAIETPFYHTVYPVSVEAGAIDVYSTTLNAEAALPGTYTATVGLVSASGSTLLTEQLAFSLAGPELVVTSVPSTSLLAAGQVHTLTFEIENQGNASGQGWFHFAMGILEDETQSLWLEPGEQTHLDFRFFLPASLESKAYLATYVISDTNGASYGDLVVNVEGIKLAVDAQWNQATYTFGETALLSLTAENQSSSPTPALYARVVYHNQVLTQALDLQVGETRVIEFPLVADWNQENKVAYGIYELQEQKGVYLNTTYFNWERSDVTVVLDRQLYRPGDTVEVTVDATITGTLDVVAPGYTGTITLTNSITGFQFVLPDDLMRGTYNFNYWVNRGLPRRVRFDVEAPWVRVVEARLGGVEYVPGDEVELDLLVASSEPVEVLAQAWIGFPDGTKGNIFEQTVLLDAVENNHLAFTLPLTGTQAGSHRLVYLLVNPNNSDQAYALGAEVFDVGNVTLLGLQTQQAVYPLGTEIVSATATVFASRPTSTLWELVLDGNVVGSESVQLQTGTQNLVLTLPSVSPGRHELAVRLLVEDLINTAQVAFDYGTNVVDLATQSPHIVATGNPTRTVSVRVYNRGGTESITTTVQLWDGDPAGTGVLLGTEPVPALPPGASQEVEFYWDVWGAAGLHSLTAMVDPQELVAEYHEDNNQSVSTVAISPFELVLETTGASFEIGAPVTMTVRATNLMTTPASLVLTTTATLYPATTVFTDAKTLQVPAFQRVVEQVIWNTTGMGEGAYTLRVLGDSSDIHQTSETRTVWLVPGQHDEPPQVSIVGMGANSNEGETIAFTALITDTDTPAGHTWRWDFGDGMGGSDVVAPTYAYADDGVYLVTVTVTDTTGLTETDGVYITVNNVAPTVDAGPDQLGSQADEFVFQGSFTDPGAVDTHAIQWDFGDGTFATGVMTPTHVFTDAGIYTVALTVTDDDGGVGMDTLVVTMIDVEPVVDAGADQVVDEGSPVSFQGNLLNADLVDAAAIVWDFGEGNTASGSLTATHVYDDNGIFTATLTVIDEHGATGTDNLMVTVNNVAPIADFVNLNETISEGGTATLVFSNQLDPSQADSDAGFRYSIDGSGDGTFELSSSTLTSFDCQYPDDGTVMAKGRIADKDGGSNDYYIEVLVENAAPAVGKIMATIHPIQVGTATAATASFTDIGMVDTHTAVWNWGDGTTSSGQVTESNGSGTVVGTHQYALPGVYTIILTVTDDGGGVGTAVFQYVVVYDPDGGFVTGGGHFDSPAGAYSADLSLTGKASFGFVSKYKKGATAPKGQVQFQFGDDLNFHSTSFDWLVVSGARAQFKGTGTINGEGEFQFAIVAIDGRIGGDNTDRFRIKIWWEEPDGTKHVVYDNQPGEPDDSDAATELQGGSIVIHQ